MLCLFCARLFLQKIRQSSVYNAQMGATMFQFFIQFVEHHVAGLRGLSWLLLTSHDLQPAS